MIKVCHFADHLNGKMDGVFMHIKMIVQNTDKTKFKHYLCFQGDQYIENEFTNLGGNIILIPEIQKKLPLKSFLKFYQEIKNNNIDIIHTHFLKPYVVAGIINIYLKRKLIYNYHGLFINNDFYNEFEKLCYRTAHNIIHIFKALQLGLVPSLKSREILRSETKLIPNIITYYNGPYVCRNNSSEHRNLLNDAGGFKIVLIGRLVEQKRIDLAISLIKFAEDKNLGPHLYIVGDGELKSNLCNSVIELGLSSRIHFLGYVENVFGILKHFDLLLITSDYEGMPFVMWEAMSNGVPILSSNVGGIPEIIEKEKCGFIFKKNDINDALDKLLLLMNNHKLRKQMGNNGKRAVKEIYNSKNFGKQIEKIYSQLTEN